MASSSKLQVAGNELRVGCEIETLMSLIHAPAPPPNAPREPWSKTIEVSEFVCDSYRRLPEERRSRSLLHPNFDELPYQGPMYRSWILTGDSTIRGRKNGLYPIELVSPIMTFRASNEWRDEISGLFNGLNTLCAFQGNQSCGFHVHISPYGQYWTLPELKGICKAIIHFERAMAALLPPHRNGSYWAKTHSNNVRKFIGKTVADCIKLIQACKSIEDLVMLMNEGNRYFAWNFMNLDQGHLKTGTIEWRQPAAMTTERGCLTWVELAIAFVLAARRSDVDCRKYPGTVEGLKEFTSNGLVDGVSDVRYLNAVFSNKTGAVALVTPEIPSQTELENKVKEDQKKNLMLRKLSEKLAAEAAARRAAANAGNGRGDGGRR